MGEVVRLAERQAGLTLAEIGARVSKDGILIGSLLSMVQSVSQRLTQIAEQTPDDAAVISFLPDGTEIALRWAELDRRTQIDAATLLQTARFAAGMAVVCVTARQTPATIVKFLTAARAGLAIFPLDPHMPGQLHARMIQHVRENYGPTIEDNSLAAGTRDKARETRVAGYLLATGGTSGALKIVAYPGPLTYDSRLLPSLLLRRAGWHTGQRQLILGPLYHAAPLMYCLTGLLDANTIVLPPSFEPAKTWGLLSDYRIEWLQLTPTHMTRIAEVAPQADSVLSHIRGILHTAAACPHQTKRRWLELVEPSRVFELYSATEDIGSTLADGEEWLERPGTVGRGVLTQIRILDEDRRSLPAGVTGRIFMRRPRSALQAPQYLGGDSSSSVGDGFRSVGDYGWMDTDGYLFLAPRRDDLIVVGGKNVYPADVESVIAEHPMVADVAVIGISDAVFGARIVAVVSTRDDRPIGVADLIAHCGGRLVAHQLPREVLQVPRVPRNEAGKIQRWRLPSLLREDGLWTTHW
jgi:bile acid-coenzyme A ligase